MPSSSASTTTRAKAAERDIDIPDSVLDLTTKGRSAQQQLRQVQKQLFPAQKPIDPEFTSEYLADKENSKNDFGFEIHPDLLIGRATTRLLRARKFKNRMKDYWTNRHGQPLWDQKRGWHFQADRDKEEVKKNKQLQYQMFDLNKQTAPNKDTGQVVDPRKTLNKLNFDNFLKYYKYQDYEHLLYFNTAKNRLFLNQDLIGYCAVVRPEKMNSYCASDNAGIVQFKCRLCRNAKHKPTEWSCEHNKESKHKTQVEKRQEVFDIVKELKLNVSHKTGKQFPPEKYISCARPFPTAPWLMLRRIYDEVYMQAKTVVVHCLICDQKECHNDTVDFAMLEKIRDPSKHEELLDELKHGSMKGGTNKHKKQLQWTYKVDRKDTYNKRFILGKNVPTPESRWAFCNTNLGVFEVTHDKLQCVR
ncbi:unnamed protein product [Amoebophrya sp. A120]|nr:unnamed protein product [Amoebophrya sp. A120]|eukprot:GSA120T00014199001.1